MGQHARAVRSDVARAAGKAAKALEVRRVGGNAWSCSPALCRTWSCRNRQSVTRYTSLGLLQSIEFGMPQDDPSNIDCDNNSVVLISRAAASFKSSLYLTRRAVFVQESTQEGHTRVRDVHTVFTLP